MERVSCLGRYPEHDFEQVSVRVVCKFAFGKARVEGKRLHVGIIRQDHIFCSLCFKHD